MTLICNVVGARPNFIKMAPVVLEMKRCGLDQILVHTGQHYDAQMSAVFLDELGMPQPDFNLEVGSGSHADQTARIMLGIEPILVERKPRLLVVGGDVNSTLAAALAASKLGIAVAHVEAGLRSFDRSMPEEINRTLTDHLGDLLFTTEPAGAENLTREGIAPDKIHFVGNCMVDSLRAHSDLALQREPWRRFDLEPGRYGVVTLHRPSNVDDAALLSEIIGALVEISRRLPLVFPVHPRTLRRLNGHGALPGAIHLSEPLGYLDFLGLMARARLVLTDSGGIQEETTALGIPCLTLRDNTERPITVTQGTNRLVGSKASAIVDAARQALEWPTWPHQVPDLWDGQAAKRMVGVIQAWLQAGAI